MTLIKLRNKMSRKRTKFKRQEHNKYAKLGEAWRKPKGKHSKLRQKFNGRKMVSIGYRGPASVRGMGSSGKQEIMVFAPKDLDGLKDVVVRISAGVGKKKALQIVKKAESMKLRVLNAPREVKKDESKTAKKTSK
jgi:large subunit ribosomal protein L32e